MRFSYSTTDPSQSDSDSLPRLPLTLHYGQQQISALGLVDSGATVNVLPYRLGIQLGVGWDDRRATIRLAGNLGNFAAIPLAVNAEIGGFTPVRLVFAWTQAENVPLVLGQMNFFMEFDVCFFRFKLEFEVNPKSP